ncbi:IclR family transcriptional regulator [Nocardioides sp. zg-536]|uniref:IclR family transcriptional regulator n=1 Tax=Nocardioides faecalis TaxID=2803858 RepID=A0A938XXN3_9ACTN|nr:IclR family transcriptional regulator [Nocardioides faecalis]MBM9458342.1 IclR family transcriptional regulator [Nocardioides faecalis]QVI58367.1 IclR family transcriptional regulator [Nocardioides faecalis]
MRNGDDFSPAVINRLAGLLDQFCEGRELTLSQLADGADLPRSSVHRLLSQLVASGWVTRNGRTYALSRTMVEWGSRAQQHDPLYRAAHPILQELHASTGLVAHLAVLDGTDVRYLDKVGRSTVALPSRIGGSQPALRTALGKAIIAHSGATQRGVGGTLETLVPGGPSPALRREIAQIRQRHVAHERNQSVPGIACLAAPIGDEQLCVGALSLSGPTELLDEVALAMPVRRAAQQAWRALSEDRSAVARLVHAG